MKINELIIDNLTIRINLAWLLFLGTFISYGYFGAVTPELSLLRQFDFYALILFFLPIFSLIIIFYHSSKYFKEYLVEISISYKDLFFFFSIFFLLLMLSSNNLSLSLSGDELAYSQIGVIHGIQMTSILMENSISFDHLLFKTTVRLFTTIVAASFGFFIFIIFLFRSRKLQLLIFVSLLLSMRLLVSSLGGNTTENSALSSLPATFFGILFGINDLSFKFSYFIPYSIFLFLIFKELSKSFDRFSAYFFSLSLGTIPSFLFLGSIVEQSLWSLMCFCLVILKLINNDKPNYLHLVVLVSIFCFFRINSLFALIPIFLHLILNKNYSLNKIKSIGLKLTLPIISFLPFFGFSLLESPTISLQEGQSSHLFNALFSAEVFNNLGRSFPFYWLLIAPLPIFLRVSWKIKLVLLIFFGVLILFYYSIDQDLWGSAKYQVEIILPFILAGIWVLLNQFSEKKKFSLIIRVISVALLTANIFFVLNFPSICENNQLSDNNFRELKGNYLPVSNTTKEKGCNVLSHYPIYSKSSYKLVDDLGLSDKLYAPGINYGFFPQVTNGFAIHSIRSSKEILSNQNSLMKRKGITWTSADASLINLDKEIEVVILGLVTSRSRIIEDLIELDWEIINISKNYKYRTSVFVLKRK